MPHPLLQGPILYNGHLLVIVTLTPVLECLAVELSLLVLTTWVCLDRGLTQISHMRGERSTFSFVLVSIVYNCEHF